MYICTCEVSNSHKILILSCRVCVLGEQYEKGHQINKYSNLLRHESIWVKKTRMNPFVKCTVKIICTNEISNWSQGAHTHFTVYCKYDYSIVRAFYYHLYYFLSWIWSDRHAWSLFLFLSSLLLSSHFIYLFIYFKSGLNASYFLFTFEHNSIKWIYNCSKEH